MRNTSEDRRRHKTLHSVSSAQQSMRHGEIDLHLPQPSCQRCFQSQVIDIESETLYYQSRPTFSESTNIAGYQDHNAHSPTIPVAENDDRLVCRSRNSSRRRKSRYLTKAERSDIITRIKDGEKQAYLANEYAVSRAAICNLYKKYKSQKEVTDRTTPDENRLHSPIHTPSESLQSETMQERQPRLFQMDSHSVPIRNILHMLNDQRVSSLKFRHLVDRLVRLLIEEAVAYVSRSFCTANSGVQLYASEWEDQNICGIMMRRKVDEDLMLRAFSQLYPWSKVGSVSLTLWDACRDNSVAPTCIIQFDLDIIKGVQYFLLDLDCVTGEEVCAVVQRLVTQYHIQESDIYYVALFSSAAGVQRLAWQFPSTCDISRMQVIPFLRTNVLQESLSSVPI
uniref:Uncharacterized protein AlNc14C277G10061 n=1 Tax=Albugo laibachii Nc14 TaxID=890382 RepID=F0WUQ4_9STRA|nr:conserved hypothetical protein [Albugo laibachii Nc14]CCA25771.1 conserved hypothetical protein [Albugo laibachii Nc14]|eukprot:CCA25771.1 conserved hypothetical protein [Albugo laibachii Nc14]